MLSKGSSSTAGSSAAGAGAGAGAGAAAAAFSAAPVNSPWGFSLTLTGRTGAAETEEAPAPRAGLFTEAAEKAKAASPAPQETKPAAEEDPFDSIFKIFNSK